jgi:hypothetical protein
MDVQITFLLIKGRKERNKKQGRSKLKKGLRAPAVLETYPGLFSLSQYYDYDSFLKPIMIMN